MKKTLNRQTYFHLLDNCYMWDLMPSEKQIAVEMATEYGGSRILNSWEKFQELRPGKSFFDFERWFISYDEMDFEDIEKTGSNTEGEQNETVSVSAVRQEKSYDVELW